eukprot:385424-Pyramimonas_sp.AAC.1
MGGARLAVFSDYARAAIQGLRAARHAQSREPSMVIGCVQGPEDREGHREECTLCALPRLTLQGYRRRSRSALNQLMRRGARPLSPLPCRQRKAARSVEWASRFQDSARRWLERVNAH